ncbi:thiamine pyrophosphokinase [[Candida] anglica]|uniref:Thiamine pyrophosphokinase n=1 Tax=[Candida] anglica TaxID=148631 RepID=A0ABP0EEE6_9ASCO
MAELEVIESPDTIDIPKPSDLVQYNIIEPFQYLESDSKSRSVLLILNQNLDGINFQQIWNHTELKICADGGANQLFNSFQLEEERCKYIPHFITGDFDSLTEPVKQYYQERGSIIIKQATQYATDFDKSLSLCKLYYHSSESRSSIIVSHSNISTDNGLADLENVYHIQSDEATLPIQIFALGGIGGRFDQTIGSMHQLYKLSISAPYLHIYFITNSDLVLLLPRGKNYISYASRNLWNQQDLVPVCGLLPLGNQSVVLDTWGLKYDVRNYETDMFSRVSSSNGVCGSDGFIVHCTDPIVMNLVVDHHSI